MVKNAEIRLGMTLIPPKAASSRASVEIRAGVQVAPGFSDGCETAFFLGKESPDRLLHKTDVKLTPTGQACAAFKWTPAGLSGKHDIVAVSRADGRTWRASQELTILPADSISTGLIGGAFWGFLHWSEREGRLWNRDLQRFTHDDWQQLVQAQHELGMDIIVPQEAFRNQEYAGKHRIERDGYKGLAFYASDLYPGRMSIGCADPLEAVFSAADRLGMHVFAPTGLYAWFDFSPASLEWHKRVAEELWNRYGHHPSFYGWYVSEEVGGNLGDSAPRREEIVAFFREFQPWCRAMAPDKPVMLASNCHDVPSALKYYPELLAHLDILCPFAFQRMPEGDLTGREAAQLLQGLCDEAGSHLWMDMEAFGFCPDMALYPRAMSEIAEEIETFSYFEKVICYQFPGIFNPPSGRIKPGGNATVELYQQYREFYRNKLAGLTDNMTGTKDAGALACEPVRA
ncbi:MAG: DUF4434 domain-containing protein [bacterium]|nr:DUF4434 domain-containing protein [Candidatus Sumerlaeota bacterium]